MEKINTIVVGAGVVGLAVARELSRNGLEVFVADSEPFAGSGTSARNSGVIHAGIYYPKGSKKARYCVEGKERLYAYIAEKNIPFENCQKMIVASAPEDLEKLSAIRQKATDNGVDDLKIISGEEARAMEPQLSCIGALLSPSTGIVDVHEYLHSLIADVESHGGVLALQNRIEEGEIEPDGIVLTFASGEKIKASRVVNAAGIGAQSLARKLKGFNPAHIPEQFLAKGNYFTVSGPKPFEKLIYPVPVAGGLGAHFTKNMAGESLFGPDVEWIDPCAYDRISYDVDAKRAEKFYGYIEKYWPRIRDRELRPAYAGVRPKLVGAGMPDGDFMIQGPADHGVQGLVNLYGVESPGLTSSLAIAADVQRMLA